VKWFQRQGTNTQNTTTNKNAASGNGRCHSLVVDLSTKIEPIN
jgi:hypothetical protein